MKSTSSSTLSVKGTHKVQVQYKSGEKHQKEQNQNNTADQTRKNGTDEHSVIHKSIRYSSIHTSSLTPPS